MKNSTANAIIFGIIGIFLLLFVFAMMEESRSYWKNQYYKCDSIRKADYYGLVDIIDSLGDRIHLQKRKIDSLTKQIKHLKYGG